MSHPQRLTAQHAALLVIDVQEKLLAKIPGRDRLIASAGRLIQGARLLEVPVLATEQYPKGLGATEPTLAALLPDRPEKTAFNCCACPRIQETLHGLKIRHVTLAGIEAHICVAQTALELLSLGFIPQIAADAVASRSDFDRDVALHRIARAGGIISSTEAILFEWAETADHPQFKALSALIK